MDHAVKKGILKCGSSEVKITLTATELLWSPAERSDSHKQPSKKQLQDTTGSIKVEDIVAVQQEADGRFSVSVAVRKDRKQLTVHKKRFVCSGDETSVDDWTRCIQNTIDNHPTRRPRRLLVIINPQAGRKKSPQMYKDNAAALFELAGIVTDVIYTEKKFHATELLQEYDLNGIDGVVSVGGDGTFKECLNGLILRGMKEAGRSTTDPDSPLVTANVKLSAMAGGTTNVIAEMLFGTNDIITAAVHIILGHSDRNLDVGSVFSGSEFLGYCFLLLGIGICSDTIYFAERKRRFNCLGPLRYTVALLKALTNRMAIDLEFEWRGMAVDESNTNATDADKGEEPPTTAAQEDGACAKPKSAAEEGACAKMSTQKYSGRFIDAIGLPFIHQETFVFIPGKWHFYLIKECSVKQHVQFYRRFGKEQNQSFIESEQILNLELEDEFSVRITGGGHLREDDKYSLNFDGEIVMLPEPCFTVKIHKELLSCYSMTIDKD